MSTASSGADARPRAPRTSPTERAAQIAAAAEALALEEGLHALTLRAVAARAGVASSLVAHYAPSMEQLVADAFTSIVASELAEVRAHASVVRHPTARLQALLATLLDGSRDDVTGVWVDAWSIARRSSPLAAAVREQMTAWHAAIVEVLTQAAPASMPARELDRVAAHVLAMVDGLNAHGLVGYGPTGPGLALIARVVERELSLPEGALTR
ncbi:MULTISPECIES: TetR family transcriptional regulator C-terminal domain-containing protein [unclassified Microcella]|uniref:TetR family transcriptional regulator C-terminal domain-containing protein n=1 Tax=unclassified Microcella TaxID=2630066 RepID=UPI0006FE1698|nr:MULTISPECIES: TetR family transcriptional regulator C-terminal domain-containing protein [unclassified Microcella]KQV26261.1 hypothetical protein ASC54_04960 [Yonghaparkia sp. Root332]KRF32956.1 hypothetical protein ASG83_02785 [Yonghaparkia sp. Soil809]